MELLNIYAYLRTQEFLGSLESHVMGTMLTFDFFNSLTFTDSYSP